MDRLRAMRLFVATARAGSFSAAARELHLPVSTLSRQIGALEQALDVRLLQRTTRAMHLTRVGERYLAHCLSVLGEIDAFEATLAADDGQLRGRIRVTAPAIFGALGVNDIVAGFLLDHPLVEVDARWGSRTVDLVSEGFDLAIRPRPREDSSVVARHLGWLRLITVASPAYLARHGTPSGMSALAQHRLALHARRIPRSVFSAAPPANPGGLIVSDDAWFLRAMALEGVAIASLPDRFVTEAMAAGRLVQILPGEAELRLSVCAIYPSGRPLGPLLRAFVDRLASRWPQEPSELGAT